MPNSTYPCAPFVPLLFHILSLTYVDSCKKLLSYTVILFGFIHILTIDHFVVLHSFVYLVSFYLACFVLFCFFAPLDISFSVGLLVMGLSETFYFKLFL